MEKKPVTYKYTAKYECFCCPCCGRKDHEYGCRGGELVGSGTGYFTETDAKRAAYTFFKCSEQFIQEALTYRVFSVGPRGGEKLIDTRRHDMYWWDNFHLSVDEKLIKSTVNSSTRKGYYKIMATKKTWTQSDYDNEAAEFVACYGRDYNWHEFVEEYCATWDITSEFKYPDQGKLLGAIFAIVQHGSE